jgi:hypothetical protein
MARAELRAARPRICLQTDRYHRSAQVGVFKIHGVSPLRGRGTPEKPRILASRRAAGIAPCRGQQSLLRLAQEALPVEVRRSRRRPGAAAVPIGSPSVCAARWNRVSVEPVSGPSSAPAPHSRRPPSPTPRAGVDAWCWRGAPGCRHWMAGRRHHVVRPLPFTQHQPVCPLLCASVCVLTPVRAIRGSPEFSEKVSGGGRVARSPVCRDAAS